MLGTARTNADNWIYVIKCGKTKNDADKPRPKRELKEPSDRYRHATAKEYVFPEGVSDAGRLG